ncbi:hypothetical protein OAX11_00610 [Flavobacteriaceae bacterium]|nr:hypothetical protein [Flavobacteriaceae bacterium]
MRNIFIVLLLSISFIQCKQNKETVTTNSEKLNTKTKEMINQRENLVGGWKVIEIDDKIKELANYVVSEKEITSPISAISSAKSQVVSGRNFGFELLLDNQERWEVVVYENIKKEKQITKFNKLTN